MDSIEEPNESDELHLTRVNDVDLKAADTDSIEKAQSNDEDEVPTQEKKSQSTQSLAEESKGDDSEDAPAEKTEKAEKAEKAEKSADADKDADGDKADSNSTKDSNSTSNSTAQVNYMYKSNREKGDYGFDEPEKIEKHPVYKKEMEKVLGKTKKMKQRGYYGYGYYGNGGQGSASWDGSNMDIFEDLDSENDKEKEGIYPSEDEEEDEMFIHDLHRNGLGGYKGKDYGAYYNAYGK